MTPTRQLEDIYLASALVAAGHQIDFSDSDNPKDRAFCFPWTDELERDLALFYAGRLKVDGLSLCQALRSLSSQDEQKERSCY